MIQFTELKPKDKYSSCGSCCRRRSKMYTVTASTDGCLSNTMTLCNICAHSLKAQILKLIGGNYMKVIALATGFNITEGKEYLVLFEYDTVYEIECDDGKVRCRPKEFFKEVT